MTGDQFADDTKALALHLVGQTESWDEALVSACAKLQMVRDFLTDRDLWGEFEEFETERLLDYRERS